MPNTYEYHTQQYGVGVAFHSGVGTKRGKYVGSRYVFLGGLRIFLRSRFARLLY